MNDALHPYMLEATRLTRAGRLSPRAPATRASHRDSAAPASGGDTAHAPAGRGSIIDLTPDTTS